MGHTDGGVRAPFHQHVQGAGESVAGFDQGAESSAFHEGLIARCIQATGFQSGLARCMTFRTVLGEDRLNVLLVAHIFDRASRQQGDTTYHGGAAYQFLVHLFILQSTPSILSAVTDEPQKIQCELQK